MAEWFFNFLLINIIFWSLGICAVRKLLSQNPRVKDAATSGVVSIIKRFLR